MRFAIKISSVLKPLFVVFGFSPKSSYVELDDGALTFHFGTAHETIPLEDVADVGYGHWPLYYGLGAKLGPKNGVAYVGSYDGVVELQLSRPHEMNVWGPFRRSKSRCVIVSLEDADGFIEAVRAARERKQPPTAAA